MNIEQPSLMYDGTTGYVAGSGTSQARALREKVRARSLQSRVLDTLLQAGAIGCTSSEVEDRLGEKHQSVSASIRNMELDGKVVKTTEIRDGQHAYVARAVAGIMNPDVLLAPNPKRVSYRKKYDALVHDLRALLAEYDRSGGDLRLGVARVLYDFEWGDDAGAR